MLSIRNAACAVAACLLAFIPAVSASADPLGDLAFSPDDGTVVFDATSLGMSSTKKVSFKNSSITDSVAIAGLAFGGPDADQFSIASSGCPPTLGPGSGCDVDINFNPDHAGPLQAQLLVDNDGLNPGLTRQLSGDAYAPDLSLSSTTIDFGTQRIYDGSPSYWVQAQNVGLAPTRIDQVDIDGPDASAFWIDGSNCQGGLTLYQGNNCSFYVRFQPQEGRSYDATLHVRTPHGDFTTSLTGIGGVSDATLAPAVVEFGDVEVGRSATATVTMTSSGNLPYIPFVTIFNGGDVGSFRVIKDGCSLQLLDPAHECEVTLRFAPFEAGPVEATLAVLGDGNPKTVTTRGVGVEPGASSNGGGASHAIASGTPPAAGDGSAAAHVTFAGSRRSIARFSSGWAYLGRARCAGAARCRVTVRTQFVVTFGGAARPYVVRGRGHTWTVGAGRRLWAPLPHNLHGTPSRMLVTIETRAPGLATGVQYRNLRLVPARR